MYKCKHGFSQCSECGETYTEDDSAEFNDKCAAILGYTSSYRSMMHFWKLGEGDFILKIQFKPYQNMTQLAEVIDVILADEQDTKRLTKYIVDTSVKDAFRKFVTEYNPEKDYE